VTITYAQGRLDPLLLLRLAADREEPVRNFQRRFAGLYAEAFAAVARKLLESPADGAPPRLFYPS